MAEKPNKTKEIEIHPEGWKLFERAVDVVAKSPPGRVSKPTGLFDEQNCEHDAANRASTNLPIFAKDTAR